MSRQGYTTLYQVVLYILCTLYAIHNSTIHYTLYTRYHASYAPGFLFGGGGKHCKNILRKPNPPSTFFMYVSRCLDLQVNAATASTATHYLQHRHTSTSPRRSVLSDPGAVETGGTQSFQVPTYTLGIGGTQSYQPPRSLGTGGTQSFQAPKYPADWQYSVLSGPQVPSGLVGLSLFGPSGTLRTTKPIDRL